MMLSDQGSTQRWLCDECGEVHREADGECMYECGEPLRPVSRDAVQVIPHPFREARYSPLCDDCGLRRDARVHRLARAHPAASDQEGHDA